MDYNVNPSPEKGELRVSGAGLYHMQGAAKWIKIIAIVMAIMLGLMVLLALLIMFNASFGMGLVYLIVAMIYAYPLLKSFGIANHFQRALASTDSDELELGLSDLRSLFTFFGVLVIIGLVFFAIAMIGVITTLNELDHLTRL